MQAESRPMATSDACSTVLGTENGDLVLRISGSSRNGQIVRMRSAKCIVGSGPQCTLRLRARGVQPVHCVILRGPDRTVIRQWSSDTRLNGRAFTDALLAGGDRLGVGPIEFEVLATGKASLGPPEESKTTPCDEQGPPRYRFERPETLKERLALANHQGRQRAGRLIDQLRAARRQLAEWESRGKIWEEERARIVRDPGAAESDKKIGEAESIAHEAERAKLEADRQAFLQERSQWETRRTEAEAHLDALTRDLEARQTQLKARQTELDVRGAEVEVLPEEPEAPPPEPTVQQQVACDQQPAKREASPEKAPVDTAAVFRRLGIPAPAEEKEESLMGATRPAASEPQNEGISPATPAASEREEESIDRYMARLLERTRGAGGSGSQPPEGSSRTTAGPDGPAALKAPESEPEVYEPEDSAVPAAEPRAGKPAQVPRRKGALEGTANLTAMRELANLAARSAIDRHARRSLARLSAGKSTVILTALLAGGALLGMWWFLEAGPMAFYAGSVSLLVALFWGLQYAVLTGRMILNRSGQLQWRPKAGPNKADTRVLREPVDGRPEQGESPGE